MTNTISESKLDFIAAGGNRHPAAADWKPGLLAFASGNNVALWNPDDSSSQGIYALLSGHTDSVNAVKIFDAPNGRRVITGGQDKTLRVWARGADGLWKQVQSLEGSQKSILLIATLEQCNLVVTGAYPGNLQVWEVATTEWKLVQEIALKPNFLPLACAIHQLPDGDVVLAVSGTLRFLQLYTRGKDSPMFELQATLTGHDGWIRSLDFTLENQVDESDILLASASHDKYIRVWRLRKSTGQSGSLLNGSADSLVAPGKKSLSNKTHQVGSPDYKYDITFEALLIGHEDWIYTAKWAPPTPNQTSPTLLSASADNSLAIWRADTTSGVWICETRLGDISSQKGSTTATGSTGGFWIGLWRPDGEGVASLGRTGSWRCWSYDAGSDSWLQQLGVSGHTQEVRSLAWVNDGSYLLSTGADQTTRLFAEWKRDGVKSWHEFSRPQIHGYDLNCIDSLSPDQFISGADEKLLRVFNMPGAIDQLLSNLAGIARSSTNGALPEAANIPVLGLSNKAVVPNTDDETTGNDFDAADQPPLPATPILDLNRPPLEDHLARHTLWPEHEKLYGHGYEISCVASSHDGSVVATACKASSADHAVIRLYECQGWREIKPPLTAHSLTATSLGFSPDDRYLLSVGRDRNLAIFEREESGYRRVWLKEKAHARMILDCSWAPVDSGYVFATAGRDKAVKIWNLGDDGAECALSLSAAASVTAVACGRASKPDAFSIAYGAEDGSIHIATVQMDTWEVLSDRGLADNLIPAGGVNALRWRPSPTGAAPSSSAQLAVASDDCSVRIINVGV